MKKHDLLQFLKSYILIPAFLLTFVICMISLFVIQITNWDRSEIWIFINHWEYFLAMAVAAVGLFFTTR